MILNNDTRPHFYGECRGTIIVFERWFTYTTPLNFKRFKGIIKAVSGMCGAAHVNSFSSNLVECIDFSGLSGATVGWSRFSE